MTWFSFPMLLLPDFCIFTAYPFSTLQNACLKPSLKT